MQLPQIGLGSCGIAAGAARCAPACSLLSGRLPAPKARSGRVVTCDAGEQRTPRLSEVVRGCPRETGEDRCEWHASGTAGSTRMASGCRRRLQMSRRRGPPWMTDCHVGKPRRRRGTRVRTRVALAAGCGRRGRVGHRYGSPTHCRVCPARRAHNMCPGNCSSACSSGNQNVSNIDDLLLRKRSYATCRCCMNLPLQVRAM